MEKITYQVRGLSCNACVNRVKNALQPYADEVTVTLKPPQAILQNPNADLNALNAILKPVGHYVLDEVLQQKKQSFWQTLKNNIFSA
jgi:copper chaperone CopZ